jgi:prepilin-type N-terminal cleavage/methylation domain-containing protein
MSKQELKQKGFTIIEVVLVLAIAALIFLMVFIALPALQSSQRDTARKNDVSIVASAVNSWSGNNRGKTLDSTALDGIKTYASQLSDNTTDVAMGTTPTANNSNYTAVDGTATIVVGAKCNSSAPDGKVVLDKGTKRQYVVITKLESGNGAGYCLDS